MGYVHFVGTFAVLERDSQPLLGSRPSSFGPALVKGKKRHGDDGTDGRTITFCQRTWNATSYGASSTGRRWTIFTVTAVCNELFNHVTVGPRDGGAEIQCRIFALAVRDVGSRC